VIKPRYLLDTNICIYLRKGRPPNVMQKFGGLVPGEAAISVITYGELHCGTLKSLAPAAALRLLEEFITLLPPLPLPASAGATYGEIRAVLERQGLRIGQNDLWIAAHAIASNLVLITNNMREFARVPGLAAENWVEPA
jgi:tRNA(fMet)-specific endonuclease VapC